MLCLDFDYHTIGWFITPKPNQMDRMDGIWVAVGMDFPIPPKFWWSMDILLVINPCTGMAQEIHPSGQGRIDSVKVNPPLLRMRECIALI